MSSILITFEGMLVFFVNNNRECNIGILEKAPDHKATLVVTKVTNGTEKEVANLDDNDFEPRLWLDVQKTNPSVELFMGASFSRNLAADDPADFRWALDFEGNEMYKEKVEVDLDGFSSIVQINDGKFSTAHISKNQLTKKKKVSPEEIIGPVATTLAAQITLSGTDRAELWNGDEDDHPIAEFTDQTGVDYHIRLGKTRDPHDHSNVVDAENYYSALGSDIAPSRKLHFGADRIFDEKNPRMLIDPDARCLIGWMSQTEL